MRTLRVITTVLWVCVVVMAGCGQRGISTSRFERSFRGSDEATRKVVEGVVEAIKEENYLAAAAGLTALEVRPGLTSDQRKAVEDLKAKVKQKMGERLEQATQDMGKELKKVFGN